jgi:hypothetical protein
MQEIEEFDLEDESSEEEGLGVELPITDEPIEISPEEIAPEEVVVAENAQEEKGHLKELVCDCCLELNLVTKSCIQCARCGVAFCLHYASTIDAQYCVNCMSNVSVTKEVVTKTYKRMSAETGETHFYRRRARSIKIGGLDWLFSQRKISELTDVELELSIEYHKNILNLMIAEQERRKNEKMHRYANVVFKPTKSAAKVTDTTTTTVKKTRTVSKDKASEQLQAIMKAMLAKGLSVEQIQAMLRK